MNYYKITNKDEVHHEFSFKTGINIDTVPFNPSGDCKTGGIYFAREDILGFLWRADDGKGWVRKVTLLPDSKIYKNPGKPIKWKTNKLRLGRHYKITAKLIKRLIDEGANVHANDDCALRWTSEKGHTEIAKILLERGADVHADYDRALRRASEKGHTGIAKILLEHGADVHADCDYALRWASENGHIETVKMLLEHGANVHAAYEYALWWASKNGHTEIAKMLLEHGADAHVDHEYALRRALKHSEIDLVQLLKNIEKNHAR